MRRTIFTVLIVLTGAGALTLVLFYMLPEELDPFSMPQEFEPIDELPQMGLMSRAPDQPRGEEGTFYIGKLSVEGEYRLKTGEESKACFLADQEYVPDLPEKERDFCFTNVGEAHTIFEAGETSGCFEGRAEITFEGLFVSRVGPSEARLIEVVSATPPAAGGVCP